MIISKGDLVQTYFTEGCELMSLGYVNEALEAFQDVLLIEPAHTETLVQKAIALVKLGKFEQAVSLFEQIVQTGVTMNTSCKKYVVEAFYQHGVFLLKYGWNDEASDAFDVVLQQLEPNHADAHCAKGIALREMGLFEEALDSFTACLEIHPNHAKASYLKEATLLQMKDENGSALYRAEEHLKVSTKVSDLEEQGVFPEFDEKRESVSSVQSDEGKSETCTLVTQEKGGIDPDYEDCRDIQACSICLSSLLRYCLPKESWTMTVEFSPGRRRKAISDSNHFSIYTQYSLKLQVAS